MGESETLWAGLSLRQLRGVGALWSRLGSGSPGRDEGGPQNRRMQAGVAMHEIRNFLKIFPMRHPHYRAHRQGLVRAPRLVFVMELANGSSKICPR